MIKTAVILAAGMGNRLKTITQAKPKGFIPVNNKTLIEISIAKLFSSGIGKVIIGTGYLSKFYEKLSNDNNQIECVRNINFENTGSMFTLYNLKSKISGDFILLESDLLYEKRGIRILIEDRHADIILSSEKTGSGDEVYIEVDKGNNLINLSKNQSDLNNIYSELVGISKISYPTFLSMCDFAEKEFKLKPKLDYEYALVGISKKVPVFVKKVEGYIWAEVDDGNHLKRMQNEILPKIEEREIYEKD